MAQGAGAVHAAGTVLAVQCTCTCTRSMHMYMYMYIVYSMDIAYIFTCKQYLLHVVIQGRAPFTSYHCTDEHPITKV